MSRTSQVYWNVLKDCTKPHNLSHCSGINITGSLFSIPSSLSVSVTHRTAFTIWHRHYRIRASITTYYITPSSPVTSRHNAQLEAESRSWCEIQARSSYGLVGSMIPPHPGLFIGSTFNQPPVCIPGYEPENYKAW